MSTPTEARTEFLTDNMALAAAFVAGNHLQLIRAEKNAWGHVDFVFADPQGMGPELER